MTTTAGLLFFGTIGRLQNQKSEFPEETSRRVRAQPAQQSLQAKSPSATAVTKAVTPRPDGGAVDQSRRPGLERRARTRGRFMKARGRREGGGGRVPPTWQLCPSPAARGARSVSSSASFAFATGMQGTLSAGQARCPRQSEGAAVALPVWQVSRRMTEEEPLPALTPTRCS